MSTRREAVRQALTGSSGFRSAQDLYADLRAEGSKIGLTTVYRALQALSDSGEVDVLHTGDGEAVYRACDTESHHHHLVCRCARPPWRSRVRRWRSGPWTWAPSTVSPG